MESSTSTSASTSASVGAKAKTTSSWGSRPLAGGPPGPGTRGIARRRRRRRAIPVLLLGAVALLSAGLGCRQDGGGQRENDSPPSAAPGTSAAPATPIAPTTVALSVEAAGGGGADVELSVPAGWTRNADFGPDAWAPTAQPDRMYPARFALRVSCGGSCAPDAIPANIDAVFEGFRARAEKPNFNTGDPALDAVRADVTTIFDEALPDGRVAALRVDYSAEVLASGPYQPDFRIQCLRHRPGDRFFVDLSGRGPRAAEAAHLPAMRAACEGLVVRGPTPSEAEKRAPVTVTAEGGYPLAALPADAYEVTGSGPDGTPYDLRLDRPVVFNGVPVSPSEKVYLQGKGDAVQLRDFVLGADHALPLPARLGEGGRATCKGGERVSLFEDGTVKRCMIAEDTVVLGETLPRFRVVSFGELVGKRP